MAGRWLARVSWALRGRGNPLRRPADRKEARVIAGLPVIFLIAGPLAAVAGAHLAYGASHRAMQAQRSWRAVTATLGLNASGSSAASGAVGAPVAQATWTAPDGHKRHGMIPVDASARAGQHVTIWVDRAGWLTSRLPGYPAG